ncbi:YciI family protein [Sorangium sp. So ce134]
MQYLLLIYNDAAKMKAFTQEDHAAMAKGYGELNAMMESSGNLRGTATWPSGITTVRVSEGKTLATDGPYAEAREGVGGFMLIDVPDLDAAIKIAERIPSAKAGSVEIRPVRTDFSKR